LQLIHTDAQLDLSSFRVMSRSLESVLGSIDTFANDCDLEKLRFLASAVVPYGVVENVEGVPELFQCLKKQGFTKDAVDLMQQMLSKAGFRSDHVSLLDEHIKADFQKPPVMLFREKIISVADELGNRTYLRALVNIIPENEIGVARDRIKSAIQLFQHLLHKHTISANNHENLVKWLQDIGRNDIVRKWFHLGTAVQEQGLPHFDEYIIAECISRDLFL